MRVVVSGLGAFTPLSRNTLEFWSNMLQMTSRIAPLSRFDTAGLRSSLVQEIEKPHLQSLREDLDPGGEFDAVAHLAIATAREAVLESGLPDELLRRCGLYLASSSVGWESGEPAYRSWANGTGGEAATSLAKKANPAGTFALGHRILGIGGPNRLFSAACASGGLALGSAYDQVRLGRAPAMLVCGADLLAEVPLGGFNSLRMVSRDVCRPFSRDRAGIVLAEGGAAVLIEPFDQALARGARIICEIKGYGIGCDANHMTRPHAPGIARTIRAALKNAGISPSNVGFVNAHGTGTKINDTNEAAAIQDVFGDTRPAITAIKSSQGHMQGCAGVFSAVSTALSLREKLLPPIANFSQSDDDVDLDFVTGNPRPLAGGDGIFNAFGFGGVSSTIVFSQAQIS